LPVSSEQKMVAVCSSKNEVNCSNTTQYYIEKYSNLESIVVGRMNGISTYIKKKKQYS